jgi:uroporphyrinogen-III synthase
MEFAVLARPKWRSPLQGEPAAFDAKTIIAAPLQELVRLNADCALLTQHLGLANAWVVLTSPASVLAFKAALLECGIDLPERALRWAALGNGTRDQLIELFEGLSEHDVVVSEDPLKADANSLLLALDSATGQLSLTWQHQHFLIIEGEGNRETLRQGLVARRAHAQSLPLYQRVECDWPSEIWDRLTHARPKQAGIIITSTAVVDRLLDAMTQRGIDASKFCWWTQHAAIAAKLARHGLAPIGRVRLDPQHLSNDLFLHGHNW